MPSSCWLRFKFQPGINQVSTLTKSQIAPKLLEKEKRQVSLETCRFGPSVEIRTRGLLNPIQARYQTSPHPEIVLFPDSHHIIAHTVRKCKHIFSFSQKYLSAYLLAKKSQVFAVCHRYTYSRIDTNSSTPTPPRTARSPTNPTTGMMHTNRPPKVSHRESLYSFH